MNHHFLDEHSSQDSLIHRLGPRTKLIAALLFVLCAALTPDKARAAFLAYGAVLASMVFLSGVPLGSIVRKACAVLPFVFAASLFTKGWEAFLALAARSLLSAACLALLVSTTKFPALLKELEKVGMPKLVALLLAFLYRYVFVLEDEWMRMSQARASRSAGGRPGWRTLASMAASLFVRAYERGEAVHLAMLSRGFDGEARTLEDAA